MILAAVIVGLFTAWTYGPRAGATAAASAFGLFLVAAIIPALAFYAYTVVGVGVAAVAAMAVRRPRHRLTDRALSLGKAALRGWRKNKG